MKVTIRSQDGALTVYIAKKDLEARVVATDPAHVFGGTLELTGGMKIYVEPLSDIPKLPLTVEARRL
ncbi:MAG: putative nitrogen fixation protein NifT [Nitrospinae bacterium]|nr:putative nitrogen fixation protein NifT [Nitrospinota bacterium]